MGTAYKLVVEGLERLLSLPLQPKENLSLWYVAAQELKNAVQEHGLELPPKVWHFLSDADIRSRPDESEYREIQERTVRQYIETLREALGTTL